ncbi:peptidase [Rhizobium rhizosphaerae]|uniref:Peptidase n=1 Tax=Xaviernesmea rhizosphaerae TaxID=1672749 RepID=A0ABX3PH72_9HYPH|nr:dipeptidase [Xaviernesmea rhizosphaerae]OQP87377.1 peptidase [Xaviernesmea rhizosphaerae]
MQQVFDGHNDVLFRLWTLSLDGRDPVAAFRDGDGAGHIDLPRARTGGLAGGLCAIFVPSEGGLVVSHPATDGAYVTPMAEPVAQPQALEIAKAMFGIAHDIEAGGGWQLCCSTAEIRGAMAAGRFATVLHLEGCEPIGPDLAELETFHAAGLRSLGPVWSRHNIFGHGVPFAFPMSPDTGPGLTEHGFALVRACNRLGIAVDLAHITEQGFWDVARTTDKPLIATHSNAHALTPVARNLTDRQLDAIRESRGVVGLNYATTMLRPDGLDDAATPLSDMVRHIDHLVARLGIDGVALGSDFDGATIPRAISDAAGNQALIDALKAAGYGDDDLSKLCCDNWLRVLGEAWHEGAANDTGRHQAA